MGDVPSSGPRGVFDTSDRAPQDLMESGDVEQDVLSTGRGAVALLSIVGRLQALEAAARQARIGELAAEERVRVVVLDNEEAQAEIERLTEEVINLQAQVVDAKIETGSEQTEVKRIIDIIRPLVPLVIQVRDQIVEQGLENVFGRGLFTVATQLNNLLFIPTPEPVREERPVVEDGP